MIALALTSRIEESERIAERLKAEQAHKIINPVKLDLETRLGALHIIAEKDKVLIDDRGLTWAEYITPDEENFLRRVHEAESIQELAKTLESVEGFYSGLKASRSSITIFKDHVGLIPLSYKLIGKGLLIGCEVKALGLSSRRLKPGTILRYDLAGFKEMRWYSSRSLRLGDPASALAKEILEALEKYLPREFSMAFSGGLDSSILAYAAKTLGKEVEPIVIGVKGCLDHEWASEAADLLGLRLKVIMVSEKDLIKISKELQRFLVDPSPMDLSIASIFNLASRSSSKKVMVAGQGADELFGGYKKYEDLLLRCGAEEVKKSMIKDLEDLYRINLERDEIAATLAGSRLIPPYLTRRIYEISGSIGLELKLRRLNGEIVRKWILREAAKILGVPERLRLRPKKAAQYSSGLQKLIERLFKEGLLAQQPKPSPG